MIILTCDGDGVDEAVIAQLLLGLPWSALLQHGRAGSAMPGSFQMLLQNAWHSNALCPLSGTCQHPCPEGTSRTEDTCMPICCVLTVCMTRPLGKVFSATVLEARLLGDAAKQGQT